MDEPSSGGDQPPAVTPHGSDRTNGDGQSIHLHRPQCPILRDAVPEDAPAQDVDAQQLTATGVPSRAFAGVGLRRLYVTTATEGWTDEQRLADPAAGLVYRIDTHVTGVPAAPFVPDPTWWNSITGRNI
jgi:hypothetical protein